MLQINFRDTETVKAGTSFSIERIISFLFSGAFWRTQIIERIFILACNPKFDFKSEFVSLMKLEGKAL